jgi:hypothetical protein
MTDADLTDLTALADTRRALAARLDLLGADELAVVAEVVDGLARGRAVYGELVLAADRRDFRCEAGQEVRDAIVYLAALLVRLGGGGTR